MMKRGHCRVHARPVDSIREIRWSAFAGWRHRRSGESRDIRIGGVMACLFRVPACFDRGILLLARIRAYLPFTTAAA